MRFFFFGLLFLSNYFAPAQPSESVRLTGAIEKPMTLTVESLRNRKPETRTNVKIVSASGEVRKSFRTVRGVLLREVLLEAGLTISVPKERGRYVIVATATDGYTATFSYHELFTNPTGDDVLLLYEEDGKPIEQDGAIVLLCAHDKITGARHVKWLQTIEVRRL
jgi:DMSO/TMAO reductase YedYZ molybdopterin-dependent catalytic subunit